MNNKCNDNNDSAIEFFFDCSFDIICTINSDGKFININPAAKRILGYTPNEMKGCLYTEFLYEADVEKTLDAHTKLLEKKQNLQFENRYYKKDGSIIPLAWQARFDEKTNICYCVAHDLTDLYKIKEELAKSKERFFYVAQAAHDAIWDWDILNDEVFWGYGYHEFFGYEINDPAINRVAWNTRIHPDDCQKVMKSVKNAWENGATHWQEEYRYKRMNGSYAFVADRGIILRNNENRAYRMIGAMHDDTERVKAEDELKLSEQRFKELVQSGSDLVSIIDSHGNYLFISPTVESVLGYTAETLISKNFLQFIHPDDINQTLSGLEKVKTEHIVHLKPFRFRHSNGEWRWIKTILTNLIDNPAIKGIVSNSRDITEKKEIREELANLSLIAMETTNPVIITDLQEKIIWINNAFTRLYEYNLEDAVNKTPIDLLAGRETTQESINKIKNIAITLLPTETEIEFYSQSGKKYYIEIQVQPIFDEEGKPIRFFGLHHDVTQRKQLEQQLINEQKERQRKIAQEVIMAQEKERAEIGRELHDNVNQLLAVIKLYLDQIRSDKKKTDMLLPKSIEYTNMSIEEIRKISRQLCASYSENLNLEDSITDLIESLNLGGTTSFKMNISGLNEVDLSAEHKLSIYRIVQEQLNNILKHAHASKASINVKASGKELVLQVKDNGVGFDINKKRKGVGLKSIINRAAVYFGRVKICSSLGNGCTLSVIFDLTKSCNVEYEFSETFLKDRNIGIEKDNHF